MSRSNYGRWAVFSCPRLITGGEKERGREGGRKEEEKWETRRVLNTICGAFDAMSSRGNGRTDGQGGRSPGKKVPCLFQHQLTNCPRTNRDKRRGGNYKGQIELKPSPAVRYSASACGSASSSSLLVAVSIILHLIRHDDDDDDNAAMAFFSLPFSDRNLARVPPSPSLHCRCSRPRSLARFVLFSRLDGQD